MAEDTLKRRPRGYRTAKTLVALKRSALIQKALSEGLTPLEYMLSIIRLPDPEPLPNENPEHYADRVLDFKTLQLHAARAASPYVHQRIATTVNLNTDAKVQKPVDILEIAKNVAFVLTMADQQQQVIDVSPQSKQLQ